MRKPLVILIVTLALVACFRSIPLVRAVSYAYVNSFDSTFVAWTESGASPYLDAVGGGSIATSTANAEEGAFFFPATSGVTSMELYAKISNVAGDDYVVVQTELGEESIFPSSTSYQWYSVSKSTDDGFYVTYANGLNTPHRTITIDAVRLVYSTGGTTYTLNASDTAKTTETLTQLKTLHFSTSDLAKTIESLNQLKTKVFSQTDTAKTIEILTQFRIVIMQLNDIAKTIENPTLKRTLQFLITDLAKTLESFSSTLPTPPSPENPTYISSIAITLLFYVLAQGKPAQNVEIEITDATYGTHVMTLWTNEYGMTEDIYLDPGQYNWVASWNGQTKNGTITHDHYDTVRIDLNGDGTKKPGVPRILQILLGLSIAGVAVYFLYQRGRRVNH